MTTAGKHRTIRFQLTCLVLACVVPVWLLAGFLVLHAYHAKLDEVNGDMLDTARAMVMAVDRELTSVQASLLALATSPSFVTGDFEALRSQTNEILKPHHGADIIVADSTAQQLLNTFRPYGAPLPKRNNPRLVQKIFETGNPVISNLFFGAVTKRPLIAVDVPVFVDGKVAYDLSMTFPSARMASLLQRQNLPEGWYGSVLDRNGVIVARTAHPEQHVGKQEDATLRNAMTQVREGTADIQVAGVPVLAAFCQSPVSGWSVTFAVPRATAIEGVYDWMRWIIAGATAISVIGIFLATRIARRIAGDIQSLVDPALSIGGGDVVTAISITSVKETAEVAEALVQASDLLQQHARERDQAEMQLSKTIEDLKKETAERIRAMEELRKQEQLMIQQSRQAALGEMIGNIAHQWRQPLNSLGLLIQQPPLFYEVGEVDKEFLDDNANKSMQIIQHMSRTIDDFRNFFKPEKEKVLFRISEEVAKTMSLLEGMLRDHQITVEVEEDGNPTIEGYPNEFCQVLLNIMSNAKDAMVEHGVTTPKLVIGIKAKGKKSVVTITDNGGGVPEEILDRIFDPYFTTKGPQSGTGVGLFMSKTIIEKNMGGVLTVRNIGGGAEFRIEI